MTTTPTPTPVEERMARLEAAYEHLATKSDIADLRGEMKAEMANMKAYFAERENRMIRWMVSLTLGAVVTVSTLTIIISRLLP